MKTNLTTVAGYIAIATILISLFFIGTEITGYATSNATVNVTISPSAAINFTNALLDFGSGTVVTGDPGATLQSNGTGLTTSWTGTGTTEELVLVNIGNVNVILELKMNKTVGDFIGGNAPTISAMVTNTSTHTTSCVPGNFSSLAEITDTDQIACSPLTYSGNNSIDIDFELYIPLDAIGPKTVGIVATGTATS